VPPRLPLAQQTPLCPCKALCQPALQQRLALSQKGGSALAFDLHEVPVGLLLQPVL